MGKVRMADIAQRVGVMMEALTGDFRSRLYHFVKTEEYH